MSRNRLEFPSFWIQSGGMARDTVSFMEEEGYGKFLGSHSEDDGLRDLIKESIRANPERNGIPLYVVSDHGNVSQRRRVTLRKGFPRP